MLFAVGLQILPLAPAQGISLVFLTTLRDALVKYTVYVVGTHQGLLNAGLRNISARNILQTAQLKIPLCLLVYKPGRVLPKFTAYSASQLSNRSAHRRIFP